MADNAPQIPHAGCTWLKCVAENHHGEPMPEGLLRCPACGTRIPATPEQVAQAKKADADFWSRK